MTDEKEPAYTTRVIGKKETKPGCWNTLRVGVFDGESKVGEYERNYPSLFDTFHPFKSGDRWLALYSPHYTATRLMSLPDCTDIGGEEPKSTGFCPTGFLVPEICGWDETPDDPTPLVANHDDKKWAHKVKMESGCIRYWWPDDPQHPEPNEERKAAYLAEKEASHKLSKEWWDRHPIYHKYATFGFVSGCHWGDDSSDKVGFLDLTRAAEGIIVRDNRFGYIELPRGVNLKDAIDTASIYIHNAPLAKTRVRIALPATFTLDGKRRKEEE